MSDQSPVKLPKRIDLTQELMNGILNEIAQHPGWILRIPQIVHGLAAYRRQSVPDGKFQVFDGDQKSIQEHAIPHNVSQLAKDVASDRPLLMVYPLLPISDVYRNVQNMKVLCIGPRSEAEIFHLMGYGFQEKNIHGLDLISYSDFITIGDMHANPYPDNFFDIIIMGWVLAYSSNNELAAKESMRVLRPGGYCSVGCVREVPDHRVELQAERVTGGVQHTSAWEDGPLDEKTVSRYYNMGQLERLFEPYIDEVIFRSEPVPALADVQSDVILTFRKK